MTIKERAKEQSLDFDGYSHQKTILQEGYVKGATEQKEIDINKACNWLSENLGYYVGEGGWNVWDCDPEETAMDVVARDFRKAMEEN